MNASAKHWIRWELLLILRSRLSVCALLLLLLLSAFAVWSGLHETARQRQTIERLALLHEQDTATVTKPNLAAYLVYYNTWDAPSDAAFLALGLRDVSPYVLRVRAMGLQGQIHEGETFNPELALPGRFDFAFVLIYLAPLFAIALLHDVISGERHAGRLRLLLSMPAARHLWWRRTALRYVLLLGCLLLPLLAGAWVEGTATTSILQIVFTAASYLAFWTGLCLLVAVRGWRSVASATALMALWTVLTLVLPTLANVAMTRLIPVNQGIELTLEQRHAVHEAWEIPREETMEKFFVNHPEWRDTPALPEGFHLKWYFAFQQVGDESVAKEAEDYRRGLLARQSWATRLGWLLPGVGAQTVLHRVADTDLPAQLAYQDSIAGYHRDIRAFYYDYLFFERSFGMEDFAKRPLFSPRTADAPAPGYAFWALLVLCWLFAVAGLAASRQGRWQ